ncbi:regulatory protein RecX [Flavobacterium agrisoli]|uniref:Regulatory protein RecX n=1 Tax=Flavobacterium agrisoli TaxID=2793066 RepID=A0A934UJ16_9FLAO|nr:RecX family transcriptional regulator [Flavobacterium agrisoli]MBK0369437.1 RecX family transcriptional regulator [Flavobacterium agrisoli]
MNIPYSIKEVQQKIEHFCAYQDRCHDEVIQKLRTFKLTTEEIDDVMVKLIADNFLNETRFACSFARGKHRIKQWGKVRIVNELKLRHISSYNITQALKEITADDYEATFEAVSLKTWESIQEKNKIKKRKKFCDALLRKGYESDLIYEKARFLESQDEK